MSHRLTPGPKRQGGFRERTIGRRVRVQAHVVRSAALTVTLLTGGCATTPSLDPVAWWHGLEGGKIAEGRPPPPNADQPYPSVGSVPAKPAGGDPKQRARIASTLLADRTNAQHETTVAPLPAAALVPPGRANVSPPQATGADLSSASLQAASAPPPTQARAAPMAAPVAASPPGPASVAASASAVDAAMPDIPPGPPPAPRLAGISTVTVPTPSPVAPPPPVAPRVARSGEPVAIAFAAGSSHLSSDGVASLMALAKGRGAGLIAVVGYGDAAGIDPAAQAASLPLAFDRARAVAAQLQSNGVPPSRLRINAEAAGSGAAARLVS